MPNVSFSIPTKLEKQINKAMKEKGFPNKAEFFRAATRHFVDHKEAMEKYEKERMEYLTKEIEDLVIKKFKNKKIPSIEEQLKDL